MNLIKGYGHPGNEARDAALRADPRYKAYAYKHSSLTASKTCWRDTGHCPASKSALAAGQYYNTHILNKPYKPIIGSRYKTYPTPVLVSGKLENQCVPRYCMLNPYAETARYGGGPVCSGKCGRGGILPGGTKCQPGVMYPMHA